MTVNQGAIRPENCRDSGRISVLGLGNILLSDEGFGVRAIHAIKSRYVFSPDIDVIDGGTMGLDLLPLFQTQDRILIIDAVDFKKAPGHMGIIEGNDIPSVLNAKLSVHHIGLSDLLFTAKLSRTTPPEVCLVGIQPKSLAIGLEMTKEIRDSLDAVISLAIEKLQQWNVQVSVQQG